jgi:hypothetical protein
LSAIFRIHLHSKDLPLLYKIQEFYGGIGFLQVSSSGRSASFLSVKKLEDIIKVIIPHFVNYHLQSAKGVDFKLWLQCVELMKKKKHLTEGGLYKILALKSALNLGLSESLKTARTNIVLMPRPAYIGPIFPLILIEYLGSHQERVVLI